MQETALARSIHQSAMTTQLGRSCARRMVGMISPPARQHLRPWRRFYTTGRTECPFHTLGLTKSDELSYAEVKIRFQKLAMKHHPDRIAKDDGNQLSQEEATERFVLYRSAFEAIAEANDGSGLAILRKDYDYGKFTSSVKGAGPSVPNAEHGPPNYDDLSHSHIDPQVLREVAELTENMQQSGLDKGGMWAFAFSVKEMAKAGELPPLRVSEGENKDDSKTTKRRRRRR